MKKRHMELLLERLWTSLRCWMKKWFWGSRQMTTCWKPLTLLRLSKRDMKGIGGGLPRLGPPLLQQEEVVTAFEKTSKEKSCWLSTNRPVETTDLRTSVRGRSRGPSADKPREDHHYKALRGRTSGNRRAKAFTSEGGPLPRWGPAATGGAMKEDNSCHQPLSPDTIIMTQISEIMHETKTNK